MADYKALYRKWRPALFDDVSGQDAITDILKYEVSEGKLSHAYLFSGSRGTGKTTCAKILAKAVNCENVQNGNPCCKCSSCRSIEAGVATDVIEMDAASNNGVDNVRDMKDEIAFTPAVLKYRVYIIDEVHMMSSSAFNALLKTLEEPPEYVIFILATTELHKLPTTIVSRCQRFDFKRISGDNIMARLNLIAKEEGIKLTEDGARVIARISRGGMRDAVSLLELCGSTGKIIDAPLVFETVGSGSRDSVYSLIKAIISADYSAVYGAVDRVVMHSGDITVFWQELIESYRDIMVVKNTPKAREYLDLTEGEYNTLTEFAKVLTPVRLAYHVSIMESALADMQRAYNSGRAIAEIALTRMCDAKSATSAEALLLRVEELEREISVLKLSGTAQVSTQPKEKGEKTPSLSMEKQIQKEQPTAEKSSAAEPIKEKEAPYTRWPMLAEKISELKTSLSVQFKGSHAVRSGNSFIIYMNSFFAGALSKNERDIALVRGVIAESEGLLQSDVRITVKPITQGMGTSAGDELIKTLNENNF